MRTKIIKIAELLLEYFRNSEEIKELLKHEKSQRVYTRKSHAESFAIKQAFEQKLLKELKIKSLCFKEIFDMFASVSEDTLRNWIVKLEKAEIIQSKKVKNKRFISLK